MTINQEKRYNSRIYAPISLGELIDKITILEIKKHKIKGKQLQNISKEYSSLTKILLDQEFKVDTRLIEDLKIINNSLWEIEDKIRKKEKLKEYDNDFIELARLVYKSNDIRASIKKDINQRYNSEIIEEKSYVEY